MVNSVLYGTVLIVFQALPYVMLLIAMLFFIYAIIGMQVIVVYNESQILITFIYTRILAGCWFFNDLRYRNESFVQKQKKQQKSKTVKHQKKDEEKKTQWD